MSGNRKNKGHNPGAAAKPDAGAAGAHFDVEDALTAALAHHRAGRLDEAEAVYREILLIEPNQADALNLLGVAVQQKGDAEQAVGLIRRAIAADATEATYYTNLGSALQAAGRLDEAATVYRQALGLDPRSATAHNNLGNVLQALGRVEEAVACYRRALEIDPDYTSALSNLGNVLQKLGHLDEAVASYRKALLIKPDFALALANLGNVLHTQGKLDEAEECLRRAVEIKPDFAMAHSKLGGLLKVLERYDEAEESLNRALELAPDDFAARYNHATVHKFVAGDPEIEKLKELFELPGMSENQRNWLLFALGKVHDDIGLFAEAFSYYRQANEEKARGVNFNASRHRKQVIEIKRVFRDQRRSASGSSGEVEHVPIFVVGMSRSGKTLVESLLSQHEDVFGAGQSSEWIKAIKKVLEKHSIPESFPNCMGFLVDEQVREMGEMYMQEVCKYSPESRFFVNTKPEHYPYIGLIQQAFPFARVIYCHRDPLDNCLFIYFNRYLSSFPYFYDFRSIASYYADYREMMAHWRRLYGDRILSVRYEDLVRSPADIGAGIYEYCGLEYDPTAIRAAFTTDEIGHWKHYEPYLGPLRQALGELAR